jgi:predicted nucleic acid-binding protein
MKYLLDVNALLALHHTNHPDHEAMHEWLAGHTPAQRFSCAICDLGFIRISMAGYNYTLDVAARELANIRKLNVPGYIDTTPPPRLARWVLSHKHTTDAYLCQLAAANGMKLATLDTAIKDPAAFHIP